MKEPINDLEQAFAAAARGLESHPEFLRQLRDSQLLPFLTRGHPAERTTFTTGDGGELLFTVQILNFVRAGSEWTPEEERMLRTQSDHKLAPLLKRNVESLRAHRFILGIPAFGLKSRKWTDTEDQLLGTASARKIAAV